MEDILQSKFYLTGGLTPKNDEDAFKNALIPSDQIKNQISKFIMDSFAEYNNCINNGGAGANKNTKITIKDSISQFEKQKMDIKNAYRIFEKFLSLNEIEWGNKKEKINTEHILFDEKKKRAKNIIKQYYKQYYNTEIQKIDQIKMLKKGSEVKDMIKFLDDLKYFLDNKGYKYLGQYRFEPKFSSNNIIYKGTTYNTPSGINTKKCIIHLFIPNKDENTGDGITKEPKTVFNFILKMRNDFGTNFVNNSENNNIPAFSSVFKIKEPEESVFCELIEHIKQYGQLLDDKENLEGVIGQHYRFYLFDNIAGTSKEEILMDIISQSNQQEDKDIYSKLTQLKAPDKEKFEQFAKKLGNIEFKPDRLKLAIGYLYKDKEDHKELLYSDSGVESMIENNIHYPKISKKLMRKVTTGANDLEKRVLPNKMGSIYKILMKYAADNGESSFLIQQDFQIFS